MLVATRAGCHDKSSVPAFVIPPYGEQCHIIIASCCNPEGTQKPLPRWIKIHSLCAKVTRSYKLKLLDESGLWGKGLWLFLWGKGKLSLCVELHTQLICSVGALLGDILWHTHIRTSCVRNTFPFMVMCKSKKTKWCDINEDVQCDFSCWLSMFAGAEKWVRLPRPSVFMFFWLGLS